MLNKLSFIKKRLALLVLLTCLVAVALSACASVETPEIVETKSQGTQESLASDDGGEAALAYIDDKDYHMKNGFTSHLPVLVVRENTAVDLYLEGNSRTLKSASSADYRAKGHELWSEGAGEGSGKREKKDYSLTIDPGKLNDMQYDFWDAEVYGEWLLQGNMYDKSLMRNYLAMTIADDLGIASYLVQYCEVFEEIDGDLIYQGVYLLAAEPVSEDYYIQRGNYGDENATPLNTYASTKEILVEGLYVNEMQSLQPEQQEQLTEDVSAAEKSIFSADYNEFSQYVEHLNSQQMYDYFILYEFFGNYDASHLPRYSYDPEKGAFGAVASLDFEFSVDNEQDTPFDLQDIGMHEAPYYTALLKNTNFITGIVDRYHGLYQTLTQDGTIDKRIDEIVVLLGDAQIRDWNRWEDVYAGSSMYTLEEISPNPLDDEFPSVNRNTYTYDQEINKLKYSLKEHSEYMFGGIATLYDQDDMMGDDAPYVRNTWMFVVAIVIIILSVRIVRYRTR